MGQKVEFVYSRLIRLFCANVMVNLKIPKIKSFVKGKHITLNEKYLYNLLKLNSNGPKVALGNCLIIAIPTLTRKTQLTTMFGLDFSNVDGIPPHSNLLLESHTLHNMVTQMKMPKTSQRSEVTYIGMWLLTCILFGKHVNLPYIMLMCLIKVHSNPSSVLVYGILFTMIVKKEGIDVEGDMRILK